LEELSRPVVHVTPLVRDSDLRNIYAYYLKYSSKNRKKEVGVLDSQLISNYINRRYMFINEEVGTKEECLNIMIQRLEEDQIVKASFKQSVYEREKLGNTIVQGWVAIPHAVSS